MKYLISSTFMVLYTVLTIFGGTMTPKQLKFNGMNILQLDPMEADIKFNISPSSDIIIATEQMENLTITPDETTLRIGVKTSLTSSINMEIYIPATCKLDIHAKGNSHIFIPSMESPVRVTSQDFSQIIIESCVGFILKSNGFSKNQVKKIQGDASVSLSGKSQLAIEDGHIDTGVFTAEEQAYISIASPIKSLKLLTKGTSYTHFGSVTDTLLWEGHSNERVSIENLTGTAEVTANYGSNFIVKHANLETLFASASSTARIEIHGIVKDAALSALGASQIIVDNITGKILRKHTISKGIITILNP